MVDIKKFRYGILGMHAPPAYWYGWTARGDSPGLTKQIGSVGTEEVDVPPPFGVPSNDPVIMKEMQESAFKTVVKVDSTRKIGVDDHISVPDDLDKLGELDPEVAKRIINWLKEQHTDPTVWRPYMFENLRRDILNRLCRHTLQEDLLQARKIREELDRNISWGREELIDKEETILETAGMEIPEETRVVYKRQQKTPPPGMDPFGRGAFFIMVDGSGSMSAGCGTMKKKQSDGTVETVQLTRFNVASAIVWTFIQEAKSIQRNGKSHYMGIYGCDSYYFYPLPQSAYKSQAPRNPLPCGNIALVEQDFLRYWPEEGDYKERGLTGSYGAAFMGDNYWQLVLPVMYLDYVKFGVGDFILIIDGDMRRDSMFLYKPTGRKPSLGDDSIGGDAADYFEKEGKDWGINLPHDPKNPTVLMKLQDYMMRNQCGEGYVCWIIPEGKPVFTCPKCGALWPGGVRYVGIDVDDQAIIMECMNNKCTLKETNGKRIYKDPYKKKCESRNCGFGGCVDCKFMYLILGGMFKNGTNIFRGTSADNILSNIASTIHDQQIRRIVHSAEVDVTFQQDDEDD